MSYELIHVTADEVVPIRVAAYSSLGVSPAGRSDNDYDPSSRHMAIRIDGEIVAVSTLNRDPSPRNNHVPVWRIRGMATLPSAQRNGYGGKLLQDSIRHVAGNDGGLLWGNLRIDAIAFYERYGFEVQDDVFATNSGALHRYGELMITSTPAPSEPIKEVLFVCVHNSGRSRMAEAFFNDEMDKRGITSYRATSAGTSPSSHANPAVIASMAEIGIDIPDAPGRLLTSAITQNTVMFISMGCGDAEACPARLQADMEDWELPDPNGKSVDEVREIREAVRACVITLLQRLNLASA